MSEEGNKPVPVVADLKSDLSEFTKLHQLLDEAIKDLRKCEASEQYQIYMGSWHVPNKYHHNGATLCSVCLAGSVLAQHCGESATMHAEFWSNNSIRSHNLPYVGGVRCDTSEETATSGDNSEKYPPELCSKLIALNSLRDGHIRQALNYFYGVPMSVGAGDIAGAAWDCFNTPEIKAEYNDVKVVFRSTQGWIDWPTPNAVINYLYEGGDQTPKLSPTVQCCSGSRWPGDRDQFFADMRTICDILAEANL